MEELKFLMKAKCGSIAKVAEITGLSVDTINRRLKDGDWRLTECDLLIKALDIAPSFVYLIFFEQRLANKSSGVTK